MSGGNSNVSPWHGFPCGVPLKIQTEFTGCLVLAVEYKHRYAANQGDDITGQVKKEYGWKHFAQDEKRDAQTDENHSIGNHLQ
jgi:hypothetical protein